jgi:hypothetical protein
MLQYKNQVNVHQNTNNHHNHRIRYNVADTAMVQYKHQVLGKDSTENDARSDNEIRVATVGVHRNDDNIDNNIDNNNNNMLHYKQQVLGSMQEENSSQEKRIPPAPASRNQRVNDNFDENEGMLQYLHQVHTKESGRQDDQDNHHDHYTKDSPLRETISWTRKSMKISFQKASTI